MIQSVLLDALALLPTWARWIVTIVGSGFGSRVLWSYAVVPTFDRLLRGGWTRHARELDQRVVLAIENEAARVRVVMREKVLREDFAHAAERDKLAQDAVDIGKENRNLLDGILRTQVAQASELRVVSEMKGLVKTIANGIEGIRDHQIALAEEQGRLAAAVEQLKKEA